MFSLADCLPVLHSNGTVCVVFMKRTPELFYKAHLHLYKVALGPFYFQILWNQRQGTSILIKLRENMLPSSTVGKAPTT